MTACRLKPCPKPAELQRRRMGPEPGTGFPDPKTGPIQIEWREDGRRLSQSLGHRDWARAKRQADEVATGRGAQLVSSDQGQTDPEPLTLKELSDTQAGLAGGQDLCPIEWPNTSSGP